jgi:hypothetical protein
MFVVAVHTIEDPQGFWEAAQAGISTPPEGVTLHSALPNADGSKAICVWEADSEQTVRATVEDMVGAYSSNDYFEVEAKNAIGLPAGAAI